jgi:hypothetical protein
VAYFTTHTMLQERTMMVPTTMVGMMTVGQPKGLYPCIVMRRVIHKATEGGGHPTEKFLSA